MTGGTNNLLALLLHVVLQFRGPTKSRHYYTHSTLNRGLATLVALPSRSYLQNHYVDKIMHTVKNDTYASAVLQIRDFDETIC